MRRSETKIRPMKGKQKGERVPSWKIVRRAVKGKASQMAADEEQAGCFAFIPD